MNPDEVVALGAAVQGGVFSGDVSDILLLDVTPLSLGIETLGSVNTVLISRNTTIPAGKSEIFSTATDNQSSVDITVLQGERQFSSDNRVLGSFQLTDIPPAPRGVPQIEVKFDIDANGILNVSAKDKATGKEQSITINNSSSLSEDEIENMIKDAEKFEEEDRHKMEAVESRNKLDTLAYHAESFLEKNSDNITEDHASTITSEIENAKESLASGENMNSVFASLEKASHEATASMMASQDSDSDNSNNSSDTSKNNDDDVIDVDFEDA